ncbi:MAG: Smr/MutS family protein [Bacteroides sp.]|nr:Smr/MutS family protein [Bacteroides sp.]
MIFPENFEDKIGFTSVRRSIASMCISECGADFCSAMDYSTSFLEVRDRLLATNEMVSILKSADDIPLSNFRDVGALLASLQVEGTFLTAEELFSLRKSLTAMDEITAFFRRHVEDETPQYPKLTKISQQILSFSGSVRVINAVIDPLGDIRDSASEALAQIRRSLSTMTGTISTIMRRVVASAVSAGYIDSDTTPTLRDGRLVLPVSPMHKRKINGIVHDESATGKTVFIEPAEIVEVNNRVRELQIEERREIKRILLATASSLRPYVDDMLASHSVVGHLDFIHSKALYAVAVGATMPNISDSCELELYHACHPVLQQALESSGKEIVPLNIVLSQTDRILLISGPNAGGKSICLKTVGIMQYMLQCGVLPTVYENSHMGIFEDIFIDIGDNQSIENELSTYSSHLRNMNVIVKKAGPRSLVLIDEFGSGTEPQIGGAIAQAILGKINSRGVWGVITTHYQNLKQFADDTEGLINGSMLYDRQRMTPLFQLSIGHPGSSFAIEIARKTGLPADIIDEATKLVGSEYINMDRYLLDIARDRRYWEKKRYDIRQKEKKLEESLQRYGNDAEQLRARRNEIIAEAKEEARKILDSSNALIERTISDIRKSQAEKSATVDAREKLKHDKEHLLKSHPKETKLLSRAPKAKKQRSAMNAIKPEEPFSIGDVVKLDGEGTPGKIIDLRDGKAVVVFGQLKTTVALNRLRHTMSKISSGASRTASVVAQQTIDNSRSRQLEFNRQLDVRGMRVDEALQAVTYYIDDAVQFSISPVRILHGTGTGALRQAIREYLNSVPAVKSFADEHVQFGGAGITVVNL